MGLPLGNHSALSCQSLEGPYIALSFCKPDNQDPETSSCSKAQHMSMGRAAPEHRDSDSWSHSVARMPEEGHLTQPRGQRRLPGRRDRVQGRGVSQATGVRSVMKGIPG